MGDDVKNGLLVVRLNPNPEIEAEFNDWYDTEHVPERLAVPGFQSARRFQGGEVFRYVTMYDLASPEVLTSDGYRVFFDGRRRTAWTARVGRQLQRVDRRAYRQLAAFPESAPNIHPEHGHMVLRSVEVEPAALPALVEKVAAHVKGVDGLNARVFVGVQQTEGFATKLTQRQLAPERDALVCYTAQGYAGVAHAMADGIGGQVETLRSYVRVNPA